MSTVPNPNRQSSQGHQAPSHSRDEILKTDRATRARDNLKGAFAGDENDDSGGSHLKDRKLPRDSDKTPKI